MNGECCDQVTVTIRMGGDEFSQTRRLDLGAYLRLRQYAAKHVGVVGEIQTLREGFVQEPTSVFVEPSFQPNRVTPLDEVRAGNTSDSRWRNVDPKRWVIDSVEAKGSLL